MTLIEYVRIATAVLGGCVGAAAILSIGYCFWLTLAAVSSVIFSGEPKDAGFPSTRFCILIPAHDEELVIGKTLSGVAQQSYPKELVKALVIADNCKDGTSAIARRSPGIDVLERTDLERRGKGYALNWALEKLVDRDDIDTFVIIDADTRMDSNFLSFMDKRRRTIGDGKFAAQGRYDVENATETWRTALMAGALSLVHVLRPTARESLGLTVGLKGNGMAFDRAILRDEPWSGTSLTEDIEYALDLLEKHDIRILFVAEARVAALMPTTASGAETQRQRWENGRSLILRQRTVSLLVKSITRRKPACFDAAMDLLVPPLAEMSLLLAAWFALIGLLAIEGGKWSGQLVCAVTCVTALTAYVLIGFEIAGVPTMTYKALLYAPFYAMWKIVVRLKPPKSGSGAWVRTAREGSLNEPVPTIDLESTAEAAEGGAARPKIVN